MRGDVPFDIFNVCAKICRMIDLGLKKDSAGLVTDELWWLHCVSRFHEEVIRETARLDRQHEVAPSFLVSISSYLAPHFQCVACEAVFAAAFLV
jgi:hypothetical protein